MLHGDEVSGVEIGGEYGMVAIIGFVIVLGSVLVGFAMAGGKFGVLVQPAEFVVIGGAAIGALVVGQPLPVLRDLSRQIPWLFTGSKAPRDYLEVLQMGFELLTVARREGLVALEQHLEDPRKSPILSKYARFTADHRALTFLTDTLELFTSGVKLGEHELAELLDADLEIQKEEEARPARALVIMGDALPGLGIVAAVLGIVVTMGHIDGPPSEIGKHVGAALVGTFLGVLLSYGIVQPMAGNIAAKVEDRVAYMAAIKEVLISIYKGANPTVAVELARRSLPADVRPTSAELAEACRSLRAAGGANG
ncbi:MAG: flagellar motor stator protein MotA [Myxococcota bacterium]|nr:flagellar motor stator protein MotA [Myxococcota bacterium]